MRLPSVTWWKGYLFGLLMGVVLTGVIPIVITEAMT